MTHIRPVRSCATVLVASALSTAAAAQTVRDETAESFQLDPLIIYSERLAVDGTTVTVDPDGLSLPPASDGGALLSTIPGVAAGRMGGFGLEVVIRGMQKNQLNILDAGGFTYGACPSRMDPPASMAAFYRADAIIVEKGYSSVTNGPGGPGGTVRLERETPRFEDGRRITGSLRTGASSNGNGREVSGEIAVDLGYDFYMELSGEYKDADDYEDGSGRTERSGYTQKSAGVTFGYDDGTLDLAFDIEKDRAEDVKFAGASMDTPLSKTTTYRLRGGVNLDAGVLTRIEGVLYSSEVDHRMDNYSLRTPSGMSMLSPTSSDTYGGKVEAHLDFGRTIAKVGVDYQSNNRHALGYMAMMGMAIDMDNPSSLSWPDVTIAQTGLFAETDTALTDRTSLRLGLRYDHVRASAGEANGGSGYSGTTPNAYYQMVYGTDFDEARTEDNFGGLIRLEHDLSGSTKVFAGLSRSVRTADASERAIARGSSGTPTQVGNPDIAPEKHNQLDLGIEVSHETWSFDASAFYDRVDDFILTEVTASGMSDLTTYRNVSAELAGIELSGQRAFGHLVLSGDLAYTYGGNRSDGGALAQIPPLQGSLGMSYDAGLWSAGTRVNWAARQGRIDADIDPGKTAGYATLDLFGTYRVSENVSLLAGIDNVFDKTYATHLGRANVFDSSVTRVYEPGRSAYLMLEMRF